VADILIHTIQASSSAVKGFLKNAVESKLNNVVLDSIDDIKGV